VLPTGSGAAGDPTHPHDRPRPAALSSATSCCPEQLAGGLGGMGRNWADGLLPDAAESEVDVDGIRVRWRKLWVCIGS
jgi:hypothetical protein